MRLFDSAQLYNYLTDVKGVSAHHATDWLSELNDYYDTLNHLKDTSKPLPDEEEEEDAE